MKSHLTSSSADLKSRNDREAKKPPKAALPTTSCGYGLRENPEKTRRRLEFGRDQNCVLQRCRECGMKFNSWKVLFHHMMKCHPVNYAGSLEEEEEPEFNSRDSRFWNEDTSNLVADSQSSDVETGLPNWKKSQRKKRYSKIKVLDSSSSSHVSDIEQELEDVAMCLMTLSRDFSNAIDGVIHTSMADSSNNNPVSVIRKDLIAVDDRDVHSPPKRVNARADLYLSGNFNRRSRTNQNELEGVEITEMSSGKNLDEMDENHLKASNNVSSILRKREFSNDSQVRKSSSKMPLTLGGTEPEVDRDLEGGRNRFQCHTCEKIFHSYQALGGHRASHRKSKACSGFEDSSTEAIATEWTETETETINELKKKRKKETRGAEHGCPICLRVFPSGQALGGHKRSHMATAYETRNSQTRLTAIPEQAPVPEVRGFLDLNLPAPLENEEEDCSSIVRFKP